MGLIKSLQITTLYLEAVKVFYRGSRTPGRNGVQGWGGKTQVENETSCKAKNSEQDEVSEGRRSPLRKLLMTQTGMIHKASSELQYTE